MGDCVAALMRDGWTLWSNGRWVIVGWTLVALDKIDFCLYVHTKLHGGLLCLHTQDFRAQQITSFVDVRGEWMIVLLL